jgi:hypothetical protein
MLNAEWTTRLERGPYWSEREDDKGTFFRGPPGCVSIRGSDNQSLPGEPVATDGGFYLPKDPKEPVKIYRYFTTSEAPVEVPPDSLTCSTLGYAKDPASRKISLATFTTAGAAGGAAGGVIGRSAAGGGGMSYRRAAGIGAAGGALGGLIVGAIINADVGKIIYGLPIQESSFIDELHEFASKREHLRQVSLPADPEESQPSRSGRALTPPSSGQP